MHIISNISDIIVINFREGSLLLYLVVVLLYLLLYLSFFGIIGLGIDLNGVLRYSVIFDILPCPISSR
jgi:hypothetical protein